MHTEQEPTENKTLTTASKKPWSLHTFKDAPKMQQKNICMKGTKASCSTAASKSQTRFNITGSYSWYKHGVVQWSDFWANRRANVGNVVTMRLKGTLLMTGDISPTAILWILQFKFTLLEIDFSFYCLTICHGNVLWWKRLLVARGMVAQHTKTFKSRISFSHPSVLFTVNA